MAKSLGNFSLPRIRRCDGENRWQSKPTVDLPVPVHVDQYAIDQQRVVDEMLAIVPEIEIFNYGVVGTPGISDIDLLCIVPDDIGAAQRSALARIKLSHLFSHGPIMVPRAARKDLHWLLPISDLHRVAARREIELPAPLTPVQKTSLALLDCFNGGIVRWKAFRTSRTAPALRVRKSFLSIWSARHSIICGEIAGLPVAPRWVEFMDRAADARATWRREERVDWDLHFWLLDEVECVLTEVVEASARKIERELRENLPAAQLAGGRSVVAPSDSGWSSAGYALVLNGRPRSYNLLHVPTNVLALLHWRAGGQGPLDEAARKRVALARLRTELAGIPPERYEVLAARLFEQPVSVFRKRLLDAMALRIVARKS